MKKKALAAAILAATTLSAAPAFAAQNPFKDIPKDHWAYDAVSMLAKDGVIDGYGDGQFSGDKLMNRYEMAQIVAKAAEKYGSVQPKDKGAINKLKKEFSAELKDMDFRLTNVESDVQDLKKNQSSFKWYGDTRLRFFQNKDNQMVKPNNYWGKSQDGKERQWEKRVRLGIWGNPAKNISVDGRIKYEDTSDYHGGTQWDTTDPNGSNYNTWDGSYRNQSNFKLDKISLFWDNAGTRVAVGRNEFNLGQGGLWWENSMDGAYVSHQFGPKVNIMAGYGDMSAEGWQDDNMYAYFSNTTVKASPATTFTLATLHTNSTLRSYDRAAKGDRWQQIGDNWYNMHDAGAWKDKDYKFNQFALGVNTQLAPKWNLIAEGIYNNIADRDSSGNKLNRKGFWTRLTYGKMDWKKAGTWKIYGEYFALGNASVDSKFWGHRLNVAGGNSKWSGGDNSWGNGDRGWGLAGDVMLAANTNLEVAYYKVNPFDKNGTGTYFRHYDDVALAALTFSF